ncbi:MAG: ComE operon protein 1 [Fimbriimonadaceae bacterium]|nr:ComE operon protein 1 [Fimbriimonadaceae bacterium]
MAAVAVIGMSWLGTSVLKRTTQGANGMSAFAASSGNVVVHVAGAVKRPGMVELKRDARVMDAIRAAGGATEGAELDSLNLAELVVDGMKITVPGPGVSTPVAGFLSSPKGSPRSSGKKTNLPAPNSISINSAGAAELERLPGIGPATAAKIIEYRSQAGGFKTVDELDAVKGIGPKKLEQIRPYVRL